MDNKILLPYNHIQTAHCENGVATGLLRHHGLEFMTEPLMFGLGSGIFYIHIPFLMVNGGPAISYRSMPGWIFSRASKLLGVKVNRKKFNSEKEAYDYLNKQIQLGNPVGCQVGVYNLPYFPAEYRFHFNAHNLVVYGKENGNYLVSDPVMETVTTLTEEDMVKVRFAKGPLAPKGHVYYPENVKQVSKEELQKAIYKAIHRTAFEMIHQITDNFNVHLWSAVLQLYKPVIAMMLFGFAIHAISDKWVNSKIESWSNLPTWVYVTAFTLLILVLIQFKTATPVLPIYLQF